MRRSKDGTDYAIFEVTLHPVLEGAARAETIDEAVFEADRAE